MAKIFDCHLNVYLFGCSSTYKQRILSGLRTQVFNQARIQTIGIDRSIAYVKIEDLQWDTVGQERFKEVSRTSFKGAHGVFLVYYSNSRESFEFIIKNFHKTVRSINKRVKIVILRLQEPGDDEISIDEGIQYSQSLGVYHMQIVCKNRDEIIEVLRIAGRDILSLIESI